MSTVPDSIIAKVKKLLALADPSRGATPAEAAAAMAKAQQIITEYGIDQARLAAERGEKPQFTIHQETVSMHRAQRYDFENNIASILKKCFQVDIIWTRVYEKYTTGKKAGEFFASHAYIIIGDVGDVALAKMAIPILIDAMLKGVRTLLKSRGEKWTATVGRSFYDGLTVGYVEGSEQGKAKARAGVRREDADAYALVVVDKADAIVSYTKKAFPDLKFHKSHSNRGFDHEAYGEGFRKGSSLDLNGSKGALL